ncbi:MAG TPA: type 4a pilus biogenesis protein PilO, partial [Kofleriaceae bacterium]|nr:type 4a pilus biogenesis protein PilO [Kofleriaceae bacterium]
MSDFGRLPTSRKVMVFVVTGVLLGGLYVRFIYKPLEAKTAEARAVHESTLRAHAAGVANLKKYDELRPEMDKLREQLERNQAALPTEAEVPAFFETLERKVKESGVEIAKWTKRAEEPIESFVKVPVEIEITGTFMQIKRFFASLVQKNVNPGASEERERIVSIESLVISQPQVRNRELILAAKFVAVTFRQDERAGTPGRPGTAPAPPVPPPLRPKGATPAPGSAPAPTAGSAPA